MEKERLDVDRATQLRAFEKDLEEYEDKLDTLEEISNPTPTQRRQKRRLEDRINSLRNKIASLPK
jgi:chaperonin cofactor prefoldin